MRVLMNTLFIILNLLKIVGYTSINFSNLNWKKAKLNKIIYKLILLLVFNIFIECKN